LPDLEIAYPNIPNNVDNVPISQDTFKSPVRIPLSR